MKYRITVRMYNDKKTVYIPEVRVFFFFYKYININGDEEDTIKQYDSLEDCHKIIQKHYDKNHFKDAMIYVEK